MLTGWHLDYGFDPLNLKPKDAVELKTLQSRELNNGRLPMLRLGTGDGYGQGYILEWMVLIYNN